jgi:hypothetical protein
MIYITLGFGLISLWLFLSDYYGWCIIPLTFAIIIGGIGVIHDCKIEIDDSDYKVKSEYTIKDFSVTEVTEESIFGSTNNVYKYEFTYSDGKKAIIPRDSDIKIKLSNINDNQQYTKLTVKEADVFYWTIFSTKTYQKYVFN